MLPKITIITPSLNQAAFIEQTIDSVLSQGYKNLEYIVVDGGSTDGTLEIIKKYAPHLSWWVSEPDLGQTDAINKALKRCTGRVFNWINSDDFLEPGALKTVGEIFEEPAVWVYSGTGRIINPDGSEHHITKGVEYYEGNLPKTIGWIGINQPETFFRIETLNYTGLLNPSLRYVMDKELWMKYLLCFGLDGVAKDNALLSNFRLHSHSKTNNEAEGFITERDHLFISLAKSAKLIPPSGLIPLEKELISFEINEHHMVEQAIHYFLLKKADEMFVEARKKEALGFLEQIDPYLIKEDLFYYTKMRFKLKTGLVSLSLRMQKIRRFLHL